MLPSSSLHTADGGRKILRNVGVVPHHYTASHNPEDVDLNLHHRENHKSAIKSVSFQLKLNGQDSIIMITLFLWTLLIQFRLLVREVVGSTWKMKYELVARGQQLYRTAVWEVQMVVVVIYNVHSDQPLACCSNWNVMYST
jgi:hypothetical protein